MSGGFFRGTSADQDTRFSNKQAKLLKSQKFAPELDHLVDVTKVKMDVIRPWIANRVTELLGFEDEVLINFIYGLLDRKDVNGKEVQISLTGFMEKNTGKFMKELWALLLSAQKNASGVPQQFLDAKEEETRRKKVEADRIANEIEKKKEKEIKELEQEKMKKMDGGIDNSKVTNAVLEPISKHMLPMSSNAHSKDDKGTEERNGLRGRNRVSRSPHSAGHSPSSPRGTPSRSISKSVSNSGSYLDGRHRSRSVSGSPRPRRRSLSSERVHHSPEKLTPRRRHSPLGSLSPSRRRSSYSRRRSTSVSRHRSPSPMRRRLRSPGRRRSLTPVRRRSPRRSPPGWRRSRSPGRRRSRSPGRRRSRSPGRRRSRSPGRRRSRSPGRRRSPSPLRRRSLSPAWRGSPPPLRRRSPTPKRRRSPTYKSPSPVRRWRRRSPTPRHRSPSPVRRRSPIPARRRSPSPFRRRSPSSNGWSSSSPIRHRSPSPVQRKFPKRQRRSPVQSPRERIRTREKSSPVHCDTLREKVEHDVETRRRPDSLSHRTPISMRSPQRDPKDQNNFRNKVPSLSASPEKSRSLSESPAHIRKSSSSEDRRSPSPYESPVRQTRKRPSPPPKPRQQKPRHESPETSVEEEEYAREDGDHRSKSLEKRSTYPSMVGKQRDSPVKVHSKEEYSPERLSGRRANETQGHSENTELRKESQKIKSERASGRGSHHKVLDQQKSPYKDSLLGERQQTSYSGEGYKVDEKNSHPKDLDHKSDALPKSLVKVGQKNQSGPFDSGSEESDKHRSEGKERRKHKRSDRHEAASDEDSYDSQIDGRKEAKRRKKEEKRLRKEERRRRREERRRRREDRRAEKLKGKSRDTVTPPSDFDKNQSDAYVSDGEHASRREPHSSESEEAESEQKKLEIELRKKALESLRAKRGVGH